MIQTANRNLRTRLPGHPATRRVAAAGLFYLAAPAGAAAAAGAADGISPALFGIPADFLLFAATLLGIAILHHRTLEVALTGLASIVALKLFVTGFTTGPGVEGLLAHLAHEWVGLANLFGLLTGFALLSRHFEESRGPDLMPALLPDDWRGGAVLLFMVFVISGFLDNIAAALIGATVARSVYEHRVHIGFLAAIVAASNAGGAGSVVGDTTTTMMWIAGISPLVVAEAYLPAIVALVIIAIPASLAQQAYQPIDKDPNPGVVLDRGRLAVVAAILLSAVAANVLANLFAPHLLHSLPVIGLAVWTAILATSPYRRPDWTILPETMKGSLFLLALVTAASLMPVDRLPAASWETALGLGFISAVFDNIPLTALALKQGGYDWGFLAFAVGFGGSMMWFGSSAGVAVSNMFPEAKSVAAWLRAAWFIPLAYIGGFFTLLFVLGWVPDAAHR